MKYFYGILVFLGVVWYFYWFVFASCETIFKLSWSMKDIPTRCVNL